MLNVPVGVLHSFKNGTNRPAKMLIWTAPAGIEKMFQEMADSPKPTRRCCLPRQHPPTSSGFWSSHLGMASRSRCRSEQPPYAFNRQIVKFKKLA